MWFCGAHVATMRGGDEDHMTRVSSLTNKEPMVVVKARIDIVWEVVREDCGDSRGSMVRKGEAPLRRGGSGSVRKRATGAEDGDVGHDWGSGVHRRSEVLTLRGGDENVVGVNGNVLVKRGEKESVKDFLSYLGGGRRHSR